MSENRNTLQLWIIAAAASAVAVVVLTCAGALTIWGVNNELEKEDRRERMRNRPDLYRYYGR